MRRALSWSLPALFWFGCDSADSEVKQDLREIHPDWQATGWATIDQEALNDFYNVQRAIQWGNRSLTVRRAQASLERAQAAIADVSPDRRKELQSRIDALNDRLDHLQQLDDWRLEAEALNHAILDLDREVLTLRA